MIYVKYLHLDYSSSIASCHAGAKLTVNKSFKRSRTRAPMLENILSKINEGHVIKSMYVKFFTSNDLF